MPLRYHSPKHIRRRLARGIGSLATAYLLLCIYFWATQVDKVLMPRPDMPSHPGRMGMAYEDVRIPHSASDPGAVEPLYAFWVPAENPGSPIFLYLHGQDATRGKNLEHTASFHECGYHVLIIDYRGYAETYGVERPSEAKMYADAVAALTYLKEKFPSNRIFIYGHSLGGAVAIDLATRPEAEGASGLMVESSFTSVQDMSALQYGGLLRLLPIGWLLTERFHSLDKATSIKVPALFIHGKEDPKIPYSMSQALCNAVGKTAKLHLVEGAGHKDCCLIGKIDYRQAIQQFVSNCTEHPL